MLENAPAITPELSDDVDAAAAADKRPVKATDCATAAFRDDAAVKELAVMTNVATVSTSALEAGSGMSGALQIHEAEGVEDIDFVGELEIDAPNVIVAEGVVVGEPDTEAGDNDALGVRLVVNDGVEDVSGVSVTLADMVDDVDGCAPCESEAVGVCVDVCVADGVVVAESVAVALSEPDCVGEIDGDTPTLRDEVGVAVIVDEIELVLEGVNGGVAVSEVVCVGDGVAVCDGVVDTLWVARSLPDDERDAPALNDDVGDRVVVEEVDCVGVGVDRGVEVGVDEDVGVGEDVGVSGADTVDVSELRPVDEGLEPGEGVIVVVLVVLLVADGVADPLSVIVVEGVVVVVDVIVPLTVDEGLCVLVGDALGVVLAVPLSELVPLGDA